MEKEKMRKIMYGNKHHEINKEGWNGRERRRISGQRYKRFGERSGQNQKE